MVCGGRWSDTALLLALAVSAARPEHPCNQTLNLVRVRVAFKALRPHLALEEDHLEVGERITGKLSKLLDFLERLFVLKLGHIDSDLAGGVDVACALRLTFAIQL